MSHSNGLTGSSVRQEDGSANVASLAAFCIPLTDEVRRAIAGRDLESALPAGVLLNQLSADGVVTSSRGMQCLLSAPMVNFEHTNAVFFPSRDTSDAKWGLCDCADLVEEGYVTAGYFYEAKSGHRENEPSISSMNIIGDESIALGSLINRYGAKLGISGILTSGGVQFFREGQELSESSAIGALIAEYNTDHLPAELSSAQPVSKLVVVDCSEQPRNVMYCPDDTVLRNVLENMWAVARFQGDYFVQPTGSGSYNEAGFYADGVISSLGQLGSFHGCVDSEMLFHPLHDISIHALVLEGGGIGLRIQGKVYRHVSEGELDSHARIFGAELMHTGARFTARLSALENGWIGVSPVSLLSGVGLERDAIQSMLFPEHIHDSSPIDIRATVNGISVALEVHTNHNGWDPKLTRIPISSGVVYLRGGDAADLDPEITIVVEPDFGEGNHQRIPTKAQSDEIKRISEKIADNLK